MGAMILFYLSMLSNDLQKHRRRKKSMGEIRLSQENIAEKKSRDFHTGIGLLRIWMSLEVVMVHFFSADSAPGLLAALHATGGMAAVPAFMTLAFCLTGNRLSDDRYVRRRLTRLLIPYLAWPVIFYLVYAVVGCFGQQALPEVHMSDLLWQWATGSSGVLNSPLWFTANLILFTIILRGLGKKARTPVSVICSGVFLIAAGLALQYSGFNLLFWGNFGFELKYTAGRIAEMMPYVGAGWILNQYWENERLCRYRLPIALGGGMLFLLYKKYLGFTYVEGFGYQGIRLFCLTLLLCIAASAVPQGHGRACLAFRRLVMYVSRYTPGIYYMHVLVGTLFRAVFDGDSGKSGSFFTCVVIWMVCWAISLAISKSRFQFFRYLAE